MNKIQALTLAGILVLPSAAFAHHAVSANFDPERTTTVRGVVTKFSFRNPHARVYFDVKNADGSTTNWVSEGSAATLLRREGWNADTLTEGQEIQISGLATRDGSPMVTMGDVNLLNADGSIANVVDGMTEDFSKVYESQLVELPLELAGGLPNLTGVWGGQGSPYTPPRAPAASLTEAGLAVLEVYNVVDDPQVFCDTPGLIRQGGMTPHSIKITQREDRVVFEYEEYGILRDVYFDSAKANTGVKTHFGDSVARYEDGALVVETNNLLSELVAGNGLRLSDQATVVQTFKRVDEPGYSSLLMIHTRATDPEYLEEDFELINIKMAAADYDFIENGCGAPLRERNAVHPAMNLFLTSVGLGDGAETGDSANAHCAALAANVGQQEKSWRAYPGTTGEVGAGPWYNAKGDVVAADAAEMHDAILGHTDDSQVSERGKVIDGRGNGLFYCFATNSD